MNQLRIIFMGTPEFAVPSLETLVTNGFQVVAVITAPDKPQGRGQKIAYSPVKECALKYNIPVLQPTNLKSPEFAEELRGYNANLQVVVAFRMLPEVVWNMPALGTFNLHASLLPKYRGAAPINWAIINGERETGVTTFFLKHEIDTGSIIYQEKEIIDDNDDAGTLYARLMERGSRLVLKTVQAIASGSYPAIPQTIDGPLPAAPKIFRETCEINWSANAESIRNFVRGLSPYPGAWTTIHGKTMKVYATTVVAGGESETGTIKTDSKTYLHVRAKDAWISLDDFQVEGKKRMKARDFFLGNKL